MQRDPIGYYDSMNLMQYVGNNPVNWRDPLGLQCEALGYWDYYWQAIYGDLSMYGRNISNFFAPFGDPRYYYEVGAVMETKYTINLQGSGWELFAQDIGYSASGLSAIGYLQKGLVFQIMIFLKVDA